MAMCRQRELRAHGATAVRPPALSCCHICVSGRDSTSDPDAGPAGYGAPGQGPLVSLPAGSGPALGAAAAPGPGVRAGKPSGSAPVCCHRGPVGQPQLSSVLPAAKRLSRSG